MEQEVIGLNDPQNITIKVLKRKTLTTISTLLNPIKIIPNANGLPRDWQGLADLCGISGEKIPYLKQDSNPSKKVLDLWIERDKNECTVDKLIAFLEELDRFDVIDDITSSLDEDIEFFKQNPNGMKVQSPDLDADHYILTIDDVSRINEGLEPQVYDAFVLFADDDIDFATELIETMEKQYNLKFCVKDRDLVGGGFEHDSVIKLISERCGRLIVIISQSFLESPANKFFYSFAQAIAIEQRQRKIVPCVYKHCDTLPPELSCYFMLDYRRAGKLYNFWEKLYGSIRVPQKPTVTKNTNLINRSLSQYNSSPTTKCVLKSKHVTLNPISQVKFNSMVDLNSLENDRIILDENMTASTSANSLGGYPTNLKKSQSFYNRLKKKFIKTKSTKNCEIKLGMPKINENQVEKEKKKTFFARSSKRKVAVAS